MRDRLIELIQDAFNKQFYERKRFNAGFAADYLLSNGVIVLPCNVGDTVYMPDRNAFPKGKVSAIHLCEKRSHIMVDVDFHFRAKHYLDEYGVNWFTSQEAVEQALQKEQQEERQ